MTAASDLSVVEAVVRRLDEAGGFKDVLGVLDYAGARPLRLPAAAVLPLSEEAGENRTPKSGVLQLLTATIGVVIALPAPNDPGGARARDALSETLDRTRALLAGWRPGGEHDPLGFRRGRLIEAEGGRVLWQDEYTTAWWFEVKNTEEA